jgi:hypothetical protein
MPNTPKESLIIQLSKGNISHFDKAELSSKIPNCPYTHESCTRYDPVLKYGVCQTHANRHHKSVRCRWLPSWVSDGWHLAVLRGGRLYV